MEQTLSALAGLAGGMAIGVAYAMILGVRLNPYARWLGKTCLVRPCSTERWDECVIVAVSWRGSVCVRRLDNPTKDGFWIKKENVPWRVKRISM